MQGIIERIKNNVLLRCSTLNDEVITKKLTKVVDINIYHFVEDLIGLLSDLSINLKEDELRLKIDELIKNKIIKKIKRKFFIDSLALQITNDYFVEKVVKEEITLDKLTKSYLKELKKNKNSNQLNMTEDLNLSEIISDVKKYVAEDFVALVRENSFLVIALENSVDKLEKELEKDLAKLIADTEDRYLSILNEEITNEMNINYEKDDNMMETVNDYGITNPIDEMSFESVKKEEKTNVFEKYDDMTLFNKMILCLNTKEEKLSRREKEIEKKKNEVEERLAKVNKEIEINIERENNLSKRKLNLSEMEVELNSKLSETDVILLNMKPLIKGLNKIKVSDVVGGADHE